MIISWAQILQILIAALTNSVFTAGALAGLAYLARSIIERRLSRDLEKYKVELKAASDRELEHLRAELAERHDLLNTLLSVLSSGYSASHERVLAAVESLWNRVLELRQLSLEFLAIYMVLLPEEYEGIPISQLEGILPKMTEEEFLGEHIPAMSKVDERRPFVGESLWRMYSIYSAFVIRLVWKVLKERSVGKIYDWSKDTNGLHDDHLFRLLRGVFDDTELKTLMGKNPESAPMRIMNALEIKMLAEMNELIFGRRFVSMTIEEQQRITSLLRSVSNSGKALQR